MTEKSEKKQICLGEKDAVVLVPNTTEGFFAYLGIKSYLKKQGLTPILIKVCPCQFDKINKFEFHVDRPVIYVAGLGKRNCSSKALLNFILKFENQIAFWADNHPEGAPIEKMKKNKKYFHASCEKHPTTISLLKETWPLHIKNEWVKAANFLETKDGEENITAKNYQKLMYVGKVEDASGQNSLSEQLEEIYTDFLLGGGGDLFNLFLNKFDEIKSNTKKALDSLYWSIFPGVLVTQINGQVDKNILVAAANRLAKKYLLIIQYEKLNKNPMTAIIGSDLEMMPTSYQSSRQKGTTWTFVSGKHKDVLLDIFNNITAEKAEKKVESC